MLFGAVREAWGGGGEAWNRDGMGSAIRGRPYMTSDGRGGGGVQPNLIL